MLAQLCKGIQIFVILCSRTSKTCFFKLNTAVKPNFKMETSSSTLFILSVFIFNYLPVNKHTLQKTRDNIPHAEHFISCFHSNHGYQHLTNNLTPSHLKYSVFMKRFTFSFFAKEIKNDVTAALYQSTKQHSIQ